MRRHARTVIVCALLVCGPANAAAAARVQRVSAAAGLRVVGNALVFGAGAGTTVQLRGVSRSGTEYACIQGWGVFDGPQPAVPDSTAMVRAMLSWDTNAVRVPLNEDCWLGINAPPRDSGAVYRHAIERYVHELNGAGLFVILDLHLAAPGAMAATGQLPMADESTTRRRSGARSPARSAATTVSCSTSTTSRTTSPGPAG